MAVDYSFYKSSSPLDLASLEQLQDYLNELEKLRNSRDKLQISEADFDSNYLKIKNDILGLGLMPMSKQFEEFLAKFRKEFSIPGDYSDGGELSAEIYPDKEFSYLYIDLSTKTSKSDYVKIAKLLREYSIASFSWIDAKPGFPGMENPDSDASTKKWWEFWVK